MSECFICKNPDAEKKNDVNDIYYNCNFCGKYGINSDLYSDILGHGIQYTKDSDIKQIRADEFFLKAPSIAAERKLKGMDEYFLVKNEEDLKIAEEDFLGIYSPICIKTFYEEYPQDAIDMLNRILVNLGRLITHPAEMFVIHPQIGRKNAYFYSKDIDSTRRICYQLEALEWINVQQTGNSFIVSILPKGWLALRELQKTSRNSDKVFVAMWFTKETNNLRNAVERAVKAAGYRPEEITVDTTPHNDYIMNKVINMITDAKFVIADLTCLPEKIVKGKVSCGVRGGVYFEAGFARGQGKEVIHTCKKTPESIDRLHFDVNQINTIFWEEDGNGILKSYDSDFIDVLKHRIIATVGKGKHYKEI